MLTIGEFSRICSVTRKTLHHYDEIGLLHPDYTAENGYRYYTVGQLRTMLLIKRLQSYGFSLPEIGAVLAMPSDAALAAKLLEKRQRLVTQMEQAAHILKQIDQDVVKLNRRMDIMDLNIVVRQATLEPQPIFGVRKHINVADMQDMFGQLFMQIEQNRLQPLGPPMVFYFDADFNPDNTDIEIAVPVAEGTPGAHLMAGGPHAVTTLVGPYNPDAFTAAYAGLMKWVEENGYHLAGAPFDKYLRGGNDCPPEDYVTEIYFPLAK